ncbi:hypothetical protein niasHS_015752 [Heterodera schachtii]|uniref:DNA-directed DNA polymerase n=1 Tax=Heterodera schachtii TaxID=97005 RepID=A0ABD2HN26_HETSC
MSGRKELANVVAVLPCFVNFGKRGQRGQISVGHLAACEQHPHCFELVNITVIPRGPILGCIYHIIPDELTNEQLEAGMHLKGGDGSYEKIKYGRIRGMAHDEPELHSFAYTLVKNKRLREPRISLIPYNETQLVHKLVRVGSMDAAQVYRSRDWEFASSPAVNEQVNNLPRISTLSDEEHTLSDLACNTHILSPVELQRLVFPRGCPDCFPDRQQKLAAGRTAEDLYERTMRRLFELEHQHGCELHVIWGCQWKERLRRDHELKQRYEAVFTPCPLDPRNDALRGGRTEPFKLHHVCADNEEVLCIDIVSLYPYVMVCI